MTKASEAESERTETSLPENFINPIRGRAQANHVKTDNSYLTGNISHFHHKITQ
jgi:hypothetical protein